MKKESLLLVAAVAALAGCETQQPHAGSNYGYSYDYILPAPRSSGATVQPSPPSVAAAPKPAEPAADKPRVIAKAVPAPAPEAPKVVEPAKPVTPTPTPDPVKTVTATKSGIKGVKTPPPVPIVYRSDWGASAPAIPMKPHELKLITIHHTAVAQKPQRRLEDKVKSLQQYSQRESKLDSGKIKPVWPDVPYHFYISVDGRCAEAREIGFVGDTNTEYDPTGHILVCLEGNFENEEPTEAQMKTTEALVGWLAKEFNIPEDKVGTHRDYAKTACPGKNLTSKMSTIRHAAH